MEIIEIYTGKVKEVVSKKEFIKRYNKSVSDKKDNYSLVDTIQIQPQRKDYETFTTYWKDTSEYLKEKYRYTYGSKKEKEKA